jgi:hypothetical protein
LNPRPLRLGEEGFDVVQRAVDEAKLADDWAAAAAHYFPDAEIVQTLRVTRRAGTWSIAQEIERDDAHLRIERPDH